MGYQKTSSSTSVPRRPLVRHSLVQTHFQTAPIHHRPHWAERALLAGMPNTHPLCLPHPFPVWRIASSPPVTMKLQKAPPTPNLVNLRWIVSKRLRKLQWTGGAWNQRATCRKSQHWVIGFVLKTYKWSRITKSIFVKTWNVFVKKTAKVGPEWPLFCSNLDCHDSLKSVKLYLLCLPFLITIPYIPLYSLHMPIYGSNLSQYGKIQECIQAFFAPCQCMICYEWKRTIFHFFPGKLCTVSSKVKEYGNIASSKMSYIASLVIRFVVFRFLEGA